MLRGVSDDSEIGCGGRILIWSHIAGFRCVVSFGASKKLRAGDGRDAVEPVAQRLAAAQPDVRLPALTAPVQPIRQAERGAVAHGLGAGHVAGHARKYSHRLPGRDHSKQHHNFYAVNGKQYVAVLTGDGVSHTSGPLGGGPEIKPVRGHNAIYVFALP